MHPDTKPQDLRRPGHIFPCGRSDSSPCASCVILRYCTILN
ncbi:hypothetical protein QUA00_21370 [Microcoleus sp. T2B6]